MSTDTSTKTIPKIAGLAAGALVITIIAIGAYIMGRDSFGRGVLIGGAVTLAALAILWIRGPRSGITSRVANRVADEREKRIVRLALADAGVTMLVAATAMTIASLWAIEGYLIGGAILWAGLLALIVSFAVRSRRS